MEVTWCFHCLNELVHFGEQMDCELSVEKIRGETRHVININTHISSTNAIYLPEYEKKKNCPPWASLNMSTTLLRYHIPRTKNQRSIDVFSIFQRELSQNFLC